MESLTISVNQNHFLQEGTRKPKYILVLKSHTCNHIRQKSLVFLSSFKKQKKLKDLRWLWSHVLSKDHINIVLITFQKPKALVLIWHRDHVKACFQHFDCITGSSSADNVWFSPISRFRCSDYFSVNLLTIKDKSKYWLVTKRCLLKRFSERNLSSLILRVVTRLQIPGHPDRMHKEGGASRWKMLLLLLLFVCNELCAASAGRAEAVKGGVWRGGVAAAVQDVSVLTAKACASLILQSAISARARVGCWWGRMAGYRQEAHVNDGWRVGQETVGGCPCQCLQVTFLSLVSGFLFFLKVLHTHHVMQTWLRPYEVIQQPSSYDFSRVKLAKYQLMKTLPASKTAVILHYLLPANKCGKEISTLTWRLAKACRNSLFCDPTENVIKCVFVEESRGSRFGKRNLMGILKKKPNS